MAWKLSNTLETGFCLEALEDALRFGQPRIFNTDQGVQFTSAAYTGVSLADAADIAYATRIATAQLNRHAQPWIWDRPAPPHRPLRRCFVYRI